MKFELTEFKNESGGRKFQVSKFNFYFNSQKIMSIFTFPISDSHNIKYLFI
jgi:hypothetical protein